MQSVWPFCATAQNQKRRYLPDCLNQEDAVFAFTRKGDIFEVITLQKGKNDSRFDLLKLSLNPRTRQPITRSFSGATGAQQLRCVHPHQVPPQGTHSAVHFTTSYRRNSGRQWPWRKCVLIIPMLSSRTDGWQSLWRWHGRGIIYSQGRIDRDTPM